ncbi:MAG: 50S ribosomal protein L15 [Planctomycetota bacterium]
MMIHEITELAGAYKKRKRIGRGDGSGVGKTSGRGHKGAGSRAGYSRRFAFEGGQMPAFRRFAKRGFANTNFRSMFWTVNIGDIAQHPVFAKGGVVNAETLIAAGLIRDEKRDVKVLGDLKGLEKLSVSFEVEAARVTDPARKLIEGAGGKVNETGSRRDRVRGVDRNSDDRTPTNLTKKPKNRAAKDFSHLLDASAKKGKGTSKGGGDTQGKKAGTGKPKKDPAEPGASGDA